jgi:sugar phosphate isomerase/epimerase
MIPRIAIATASLRQPLRKALVTASRLGAAAVEIDARTELRPNDLSGTALRQFRGLLDDLNLRVAAVQFRTRRGFDVTDDLERRVAATKEAMRFAHALGASVLTNQIGRVPAEPNGQAWELLVQSLSDLGRHGGHVGATLAAQTGTESGADLARLIKALPERSIGIDLDPGNLIVNDFSPQEAIAVLGSDIIHLHARDGVRDFARGRGIEVPLGRGTADFAALLGALEEHDYPGYITVVSTNSDDPLTEIGDAISYLKSLF